VTLGLQYSHWQISTICLVENFPSWSLTKPVLVVCTVGPLHIKGMGIRILVSEAEVCPPVRAAYMASLTAFQFPQKLLAPASGALGNA
jgi:hypothetical protein